MERGKNILVFNCGSSSLKYRLIRMPDETDLAAGEAQRVGPKTAEPGQIVHRVRGDEEIVRVEMANHKEAFVAVMNLLGRTNDLKPDLIGHRLVHGGTLFNGATQVREGTLSQLESIAHLAPIHNPPATALVRACAELYPDIPQVLVFDTAFHTTIPDYARTYPLPRWVTEDLGIRKYGFHGTSHSFVVREASDFLGISPTALNAVSCHLGSGGASLCAVSGGKSIDNTMGYSPLQGLLMSTRSGDLDAAVVMRLLENSGGEPDLVELLLNRQSGVLGLSGSSADIRDILAEGNEAGHSTAELYLWRIRKYLGSYLAVVDEPQAIIFTDTVGETVPEVRARICAGLDSFGVEIDDEKNQGATALPCDIATAQSPVRILIIRTNEELAIAKETYKLLEAIEIGG